MYLKRYIGYSVFRYTIFLNDIKNKVIQKVQHLQK